MARPTKFTKETKEKIYLALRQGSTYEMACRLADISESIFYHWKACGQTQKKGLFKEFLDNVKKAEAEATFLYLEIIRKAAREGTWQAAAWWLERRHPEDWGRKDNLDLTTGGKENFEVKIKWEQ